MSEENGMSKNQGGGASGDASGIRTVPEKNRVDQERGGDQASRVPPADKRGDISTESE